MLGTLEPLMDPCRDLVVLPWPFPVRPDAYVEGLLLKA
jgi:hypothetical protein